MPTEPLLLEPADGDRNKAPAFIGVTVVFTVLAALIVWVRMYIRIYMTRKTWWDDWTMFTASLIMIVDNGFLIASYHYGVGRHIFYLSEGQIERAFKWLWAAEPTNLFGVYLVRVSISLFFLRIVPSMKGGYKWLIWTTIITMTVADIYVSINYFIQCMPIQKVWRPEIPGTCLQGAVYATAPWFYQGVSITVDLAMMIVPILLFRNLHIEFNKKIALMGIFSLGIFTTVCAIVKTALLPNLFSADPDHSWRMGELCLWATLELCVGMICGSIPALRPLIASMNENSANRSAGNKYHESSSGDNIEMGHYRRPKKMKNSLLSTAPRGKGDIMPTYRGSEEEILNNNRSTLREIHKTTEVEVHSEAVSRSQTEDRRCQWAPI